MKAITNYALEEERERNFFSRLHMVTLIRTKNYACSAGYFILADVFWFFLACSDLKKKLELVRNLQ